MQKVTNYIENVGILGRPLRQPSGWSEIAEIKNTCGKVWRNPTLRNIIPQLLNEESNLTSEAVLFFMFQLPKLFETQLEKTADEDEKLRVAYENLKKKKKKKKKKNHDKSINTLETGPLLDNLVCNRTYRFKTGECVWTKFGIEFTVGRHRFPFTLPVRTDNNGLALRGEWFGTSILSFKNIERRSGLDQWSNQVRNIKNGEEGRYWLWFVPNENYILLDYERSTAMNVYQWKFDIGKYGKRIK